MPGGGCRKTIKKTQNTHTIHSLAQSISPGLVETEIFEVAKVPQAAELFEVMPYLQPADVSQTVLFALSVPSHVQIHELTVKPVGEIW